MPGVKMVNGVKDDEASSSSSVTNTRRGVAHVDYLSMLNPINIIATVYNLFYAVVQMLIITAFKPRPPPKGPLKKPRGRIAVVGAGLTGVSSAAHCIAHGFEVVLYDENEDVGGIWSHVNSTSGLQLNSMLYRFFPSIFWSRAFPFRDEILSQIRGIWHEYDLDSRSRLGHKVKKITRHEPTSGDPHELEHARWIVDGRIEEDGIFDAVIAPVGTCGAPNMIDLEDKERYEGRIVHSSQLDTLSEDEVKGHRIVVVGSGASGVEAVELAVRKGADDIKIVARDDKWIIPRNIVLDTLLSMQPFGRETVLSFLPEYFLRKFHYRDLVAVSPGSNPFYAATPIVNDAFLNSIREGKVEYVRGDTIAYTARGVRVNVRGVIKAEEGRMKSAYHMETLAESKLGKRHGDRGQGGRFTHKGDEGETREYRADIVVMATGFHQPSVDFLPEDLFPKGYERPNLYLQTFATEDTSVLLTNAAYKNAIGTVGHFHIGIYTRVLLVFLLEQKLRPLPDDMRLWVDFIKFFKRGAPGGPLSFFTYMELTLWFIGFLLLRPERLSWTLFVLFGWGVPVL